MKKTYFRNAWLGLGANLGERERALRLALERLAAAEGVELRAVSSFYATAPWGVTGQPDFINGAAQIRTSLEPEALLALCQSVEASLGRVRKEHWGTRTMDIDLLHMEGVASDTPRLRLPHPLLANRAFVLVPLAQIAPGLPIGERTAAGHLAACRDKGRVERAAGSPMDLGLVLVACVGSRWGIGRDGKLLFRIPEDMRQFRRRTLGHTVILGRRTLATFPGGRPLEGRRNIVLSRSLAAIPGAEVAHGLEELWERLAQEKAAPQAGGGTAAGTAPAPPQPCAFVIGGESVYRQLLPYCREAFITHVEDAAEADAFLPRLDLREDFALVSAWAEKGTGPAMEFRHYRRVPWKKRETP